MPSSYNSIALAAITAAALGAGASPALASTGASKTPSSVHGAHSAAARAIRQHEAKALARLSGGEVWVERDTYSGPGQKGGSFTIRTAAGEPANGTGAAAFLWSTSNSAASNGRAERNVTGFAFQGGDDEVYSSKTNTAYESSIWSPYLHPGSQAGTYVYRAAKGAPFFSTQPITVTASQAAGLRNGTQAITGTTTVGQSTVAATQPETVQAQDIMTAIQNGTLQKVGPTTVNGTSAVEYTSPAAQGTTPSDVYVDPTTGVPFEQIINPNASNEQIITMKVTEMPANATSEKQLELSTLHPNAKMDSAHTDYVAAAGKLAVYNQ